VQLRRFGFGPWKLLALKPHDWAFGHLGLDILLTLKMAEAEKASVCFVAPDKVANQSLFHLSSPSVRILPQKGFGALLVKLLWTVTVLGERIAAWGEDIQGNVKKDWSVWTKRVQRRHMRAVRQGGKDLCRDTSDLPKEVRVELIRYLDSPGGDASALAGVSDVSGEAPSPLSYYRRSLIRRPLHVDLHPDYEKEALRMAARFGLGSGSKFVVLHVRESGFKTSGGHEEALFDMARNAQIEDYSEAVDHIVRQGYQVVRIGDATMTPYRREGVVDLATSPEKNDLLDLWCLMRSRFVLGCDSGPTAVCLLLNTPTLVVNATNPLTSFPVRTGCLYILKRVVHRDTGEALALEEMFSENYLANWRSPLEYKYIDNTSEDILSAVREMLDSLENRPPESPQQRRFKEMVYQTTLRLKDKVRYIRKWGTDDDFMGDGRIAQFFVERYFNGTPATEPVAAGAKDGGGR
jgi:putative glycosyltransferase (TIGR04372 family)